MDDTDRTVESGPVAAVATSSTARSDGGGVGDRVGLKPFARRCVEVERTLRSVAADVDGLCEDLRNCSDFSLVSGVIEAAQAIHRAVVVLPSQASAWAVDPASSKGDRDGLELT